MRRTDGRGDRCEDRIADQLGDLRDYGVSEGFKSVCPVKNPISHSTHVGFRAPDTPDTTCESINCLPIKDRRFTDGDDKFPRSLSSDADGVGHNPDPVAVVVGTKGASWYAMPFRIIPERGQGSENRIQPSRKQRADVLQDNEGWSQFANKTGDLVKQAAAFASESRATSGKADVLAREAAADDIDGNSIGSKSLGCEGANVVINGNLRPVFRQHTAGERLDLAKRDRLETARPFKAEREPADTAEQVEHTQFAQPFGTVADRVVARIEHGLLAPPLFNDATVAGEAVGHVRGPKCLPTRIEACLAAPITSATFPQPVDYPAVFRSEFVAMSAVCDHARYTAPLRELVCAVVGISPEPQMVRVHTGRIVAPMADKHFAGIAARVEEKGNAMGWKIETGDGENAIAPVRFCPVKGPAFIMPGPLNSRPETSINRACGNGDEWNEGAVGAGHLVLILATVAGRKRPHRQHRYRDADNGEQPRGDLVEAGHYAAALSISASIAFARS